MVEETPIPGLLRIDLTVHRDARGWFKENWHRARLADDGLADFSPVQQNISYNTGRGATRGFHAEPWDKLVSVAHGRVFAAWVDLRPGDSFGATWWTELDEGSAIFVPRGVANSYQTLTDDTVYTYLVNDHWRPGQSYPAVALDDPDLAVPWPIPLAESEVSEKDRTNPRLRDVGPLATPQRVLILGANGQLGRALAAEWPEAEALGRDRLDITDADAVAALDWSNWDLVLNAAAWTAVDQAETDAGRVGAWAANAAAPARLAGLANRHGFTLVHYSTDYVFDGTRDSHDEDEPLSPLGVYGQSKAAGDLAVASATRHYLIRTSWVVGAGDNFVRTMHRLATDGANPEVVADQIGRLTFTDEIARATRHLVEVDAPFGTYNVTNAGPARSWADLAAQVFASAGRDPSDVARTTTAAWAAGREPLAPRPARSVLDLSRLRATGFESEDADQALQRYLSHLSSGT